MVGIKADIYWLEGPWPGSLGILARPRGEDWLEDEVLAWKEAGVDVVVSLLTKNEESELGLNNERELVQRSGLTFINFPIPDYSVPPSKQATRQLVVELKERLSHGSRVGIHCRQGIGRSSVIAACVLVAAGESSVNAFGQIGTARRTKVPDTVEQKDWVTSFGSYL